MHEICNSKLHEQKLIEFVQLTVHCVKETYRDFEELIQALLNQKNREGGKTPLHLAVLNYQRDLVKAFVFLGADFKLYDDEGQNIVHFAAFTGQLMLISYFHKFLDMPIDSEDFSGLTPLHLAAKEGQEQSATLLIAWSGDLDRKDSEGMTPLHYAALVNSYRIVRHLLMKGASRGSLNNSQATPFGIAQRSQASSDVVGMLEEPCFLVKCNPIKPPLRPVKSSSFNFIFYIVLFVLRYFLVFLFVVPGINEFLGIASFGVFSVNFVLFQIVSNMDPGYVKKDDMNLLDLYEKYNGDFVALTAKQGGPTISSTASTVTSVCASTTTTVPGSTTVW
eukprot:CAMPEP_0202428896 /NCGR_PEP_ID=MMETSP1345-20130828/2793_1 /ASSEMBLY_ACC=CAM_ASM_000843 /TAXON_ID=342563 /ORGANISM="Fabrea Fabrea salina" /LENGTH=334 /DNA_ID=CAMNT_0049039991 /DNA_START=66 /DNA_END=1068 /DNA_ORIENTATION=-